MRIAIIGVGNVGGNLGRLWGAGGHEITFGVRNAQADKVQVLLKETGPTASARSVADAVAAADVVVLAIPWDVAEDVVRGTDLRGKILVDATNPIAPGLELATDHTTSGSELVATWAPDARVVKAFNTIGANNLENPAFGDQHATMFVCGDDPEAKSVVQTLSEELGFEAVDAGPLANARLLEPMAMLWIRLALAEGFGRDIAFKLLRR
jgi:NADPH-dependent F420 reductase